MVLPSAELLRQSEFIFRGELVQRGAATMGGIALDPETAVVKVEQVYRAPEMLRFLTGTSLTVLTKSALAPTPGQVALFLAAGWLYGKSIALIEIAHLSNVADFSNLPGELMKEDALAASETLRDHIKRADAIAAGQVVVTRRLQDVNMAGASEHSALWSEAMVRVRSLEKGVVATDEVQVVYAASRDVKWYRAPKFTVGQEGVWILRRQFIRELQREVLTAVDPSDFHPISALAKIRTLLHASP